MVEHSLPDTPTNATARQGRRVDPARGFTPELSQSVWPIGPLVNGEWQPAGTGFVISRHGLMLTARHVIKSAEDRARRMRVEEGWLYADIYLFAMYLGPASRCTLFQIDQVDAASNDDVAVCRLRPVHVADSGFEFTPIPLRPMPPMVGEKVWAFGYDVIDLTPPSELDPPARRLHANLNGHFVSGEVQQVHWPRKSSFAPYPCFDFGASIRPGMSGGPLLDERGYGCGVVSHGRTWEASSTAAALVHALAVETSIREGPGGTVRTARLYDLLHEGAVEHDGSLDRISIEYPAAGEFRVSIRGE